MSSAQMSVWETFSQGTTTDVNSSISVLQNDAQETEINFEKGFTIGICASGSAANLPNLLTLVENESFPNDCRLLRIIVVASACSEGALKVVHSLAQIEPRLVLVEEASRRGKADAINKIIQKSIGKYLVFINSDALPSKGAIGQLLRTIERSETTGLVSGKPIFEQCEDVTSKVEEFMWKVHNECSLKLNHMNVSNHVSDEMMIVRSKLLEKLPAGLVNDGAYIANRAKLKGYSIKFCNGASVSIDVPRMPVDLLRQRRRIIFGHFQVWRLTGSSPKTIESMLLWSPAFSLSVVVRTLARQPKLMMVIPFALVSEAVSTLLGIADTLFSTKKHGVWTRYGN